MAPIEAWARAAFDELVPQEQMRTAWRRAISTVGLAANSQREVSRSVGATVAAARRIGWTMPGPFVFMESSGNFLHLDAEAPTGRTIRCEFIKSNVARFMVRHCEHMHCSFQISTEEHRQ